MRGEQTVAESFNPALHGFFRGFLVTEGLGGGQGREKLAAACSWGTISIRGNTMKFWGYVELLNIFYKFRISFLVDVYVI